MNLAASMLLLALQVQAQELGNATVGAPEIASYLEKAKKSAQVDPLLGKSDKPPPWTKVKIVTPVPIANGEYDSRTWKLRYDPQKSILSVQGYANDYQLEMIAEEDKYAIARFGGRAGFNIKRSEISVDGGVRSNAYGASVRVKTVQARTWGIAQFSTEIGNPLPERQIFFDVDIPVEPENVRALAADLRGVIEATVQPLASQRWVACMSNYSAPSIRNPTETVSETCLLSVRVDRVAVEDSTGRTVYREWLAN